MDGIGTFAMFIAAGGVSVGCIILAGFRMKLKAQLERERIRSGSTGAEEEIRRELHDALAQQQSQLDELYERLDFTERMLTSGGPSEGASSSESAPR